MNKIEENYFKYDKISNHQINTNNQNLIKSIKSGNIPNLNSYSIVGDISTDKIVKILSSMSEKKSRALGCYMGMVIGDALGAPLEFTDLDYNRKNKITHMQNSCKFALKAGQWTDDTSMGLCLTDSILINQKFNPHDVMLRYLAWWNCGYNNAFRYDYTNKLKHSVGLGGNISGSLKKFIETGIDYTQWGNSSTSGNGSIMRNAPIPVAYNNNPTKAIEIAHFQSKCTHQGDEASECSRILTWICVGWINDNKLSLKKILSTYKPLVSNSNICKLLSSFTGSDFNWSDKNFKYNESRASEQPDYIGSYSTDCLAMALHIIEHTTNFFEALVRAVNLGGDADSLGSVVGQLAGAKYGYDSIPIQWIQSVNYWDSNTILFRAHLLYESKFD
jgi:ADP-ribosyl-[dinitrogen reductase] hydrolase